MVILRCAWRTKGLSRRQAGACEALSHLRLHGMHLREAQMTGGVLKNALKGLAWMYRAVCVRACSDPASTPPVLALSKPSKAKRIAAREGHKDPGG